MSSENLAEEARKDGITAFLRTFSDRDIEATIEQGGEFGKIAVGVAEERGLDV